MLSLYQRGDTIIEVLLAVTVFSLVAVGSMVIMNKSSNTAQQALETTLVRQQIDAQVEALRAAHQAYSRLTTEDARNDSVWKELMSRPEGSIDVSTACPEQDKLNTAFIVNPQNASILAGEEGTLQSMDNETAPVFPQVISGDAGSMGYGLWIERSKVPGGFSPAAYDFRVRACWYGVGIGTAPMELETTVRLYEVN